VNYKLQDNSTASHGRSAAHKIKWREDAFTINSHKRLEVREFSDTSNLIKYKVFIKKSIDDMSAFCPSELDLNPLRTSPTPQAESLAVSVKGAGDVSAALAFLSRQGGQAPDEHDVLTSDTRG
jgi:hypothetical protein